MTATNHALTGALIAVAVRRPEIAIPLAFTAHFAMDAIPHFGLNYADPFSRNRDNRFRLVLSVDVIAAAVALVAVPIYLHSRLPLWQILLPMLACMSPDLVWGWHFYQEIRYKVQRQKRWFSKMHKKIQWSETPSGAAVEFIWLVGCTGLVISLA